MNITRLLRIVAGLLFWPWNVLFLATVLFGFLPLALVPMIIDAIDGLARWDFVGGALLLVLTPLFSVVHVARHREAYQDDPLDLLAFFFGVELPLMGITAARLFGFAQLTGAGELIYLAIVGGGVVAEARVVLGDRLPKSQILDGAMHCALVMRALAGIYVGALLASLTVPMLGVLSLQLLKSDEASVVAMVIFSPVVLWFGLSTLFALLLPIAAPLAWLHGLLRSGREVLARWGIDDLFITSASPIVAAIVVVVLQWPQPHEDALTRLAAPPSSDAERRALVADKDAIARGLVDAALGRHTYVDDDHARPWSELWHLDGALGSRHDFRDLDPLMREAGRPFFYKGHLDEEALEARRLYRDFFGRELQRDHAAAFRAALASSWSREERFAGFINEGEARVRLERQEVDITAGDGVYTVEVHDTWLNQTTSDEEVVLFFELPESAAVTGLWLGPTANRDEAFTHVVAPRGAAQQVYREEVRARRDPALLEQVGPRQYRLRVFPIPPRQRRSTHDVLSSGWSDTTAPRVHVWLRYEALPDEAGRPPLPLLRERRNGFWDDDTRRLQRHTMGQHSGRADVVAEDAVDGGGWVQVDHTALPILPRTPVASMLIEGCAALWPTPPPATPSLAGKTVDIIVDRSLAMADHVATLEAALQTLRSTGATLRIVLGTSALRGEGPVAVDALEPTAVKDLVFFGAAQPKHLLRQLLETRPTLGDVVVILAAGASFDVADDTPLPLQRLPQGQLPRTLLVHVDGRMPAGYDDATLDAIRRSGGTATTSLRDGLLRLQDTVWLDGYRFDGGIEPRSGLCRAGGSRGTAVVARQQILLADRGGKAPLSALDALHRLAVAASVTTPYSSMIVLVNDAQRQRLAQLTSQKDRFDREVDDESKGPAAGALPPAPTTAKVQTARSDDMRAKSEKADAVAPSAPAAEPSAQNAAVSAEALDGDALAQTTPTTPSTLQPTAMPTVSGVPEPEEWLLFFLGLGVVVYSQRHRLRPLLQR